MVTTSSRKLQKGASWPRKVRLGRVTVSVYRRSTAPGKHGFLVANYAEKRRRFDCYPTEDEALEAAAELARQLSQREVVAAAMTNGQASDYAAAVQKLAPFNVDLLSAAGAVADALKIIGGFADLDAVKLAAAQGQPLPDLVEMQAAAKFYRARHKTTIKKPVADVVAELLKVKTARGVSKRYTKDLGSRLNRFSADCRKDACNVTTADVQDWLDGLKLGPQSYRNFRTVLHTLFEFAVARNYAADNPVAGAERVKVHGGDVEVYTPVEIARLLGVASADFLPSLAIGAFAGLRTAEIGRLEWDAIDLTARHIVIGASRAKTAARRVVPMPDNLVAWLRPYSERRGKIWPGTEDAFYRAQQEAAAATAVDADAEKGTRAQAAVPWKANALRHSYASYRFAQTGDAGRVAGELGNSAAVVHRHYRELVKPADAERWFNVKPDAPANVVSMANTEGA